MNLYKRGLNIQCLIHDVDISQSVQEVSIIRLPYMNFSLFKIKFHVNQEIIRFMKDVFYVEPIITIRILNTIEDENTLYDSKEYKLLMITDISEINDILKDDSKNSSMLMKTFEVECFPYDAMVISGKTINKIYNKKTLEEIVKDNFEKVKIEFPFDNNDIIDQIVIPPMTKIRMLKYLDYYFSFYSTGVKFWFNDEKKLLSKSYLSIFSPKKQTKPLLKLLGIVHNDINTQVTQPLVGDDGTISLHPYDMKITLNDERLFNSLIIPFRFNFVKKPLNMLYTLYQTNYENLVNDSTFVDKRFNRLIPKEFQNNFDLLYDHTGYDNYDGLYNNWFSNNVDLFEMTFNLHGFVDTNLLIPGRLIEWIPKDKDYLKYQGRFIISYVVINFTGNIQSSWDQKVQMIVTRANAKYQEVQEV